MDLERVSEVRRCMFQGDLYSDSKNKYVGQVRVSYALTI